MSRHTLWTEKFELADLEAVDKVCKIFLHRLKEDTTDHGYTGPFIGDHAVIVKHLRWLRSDIKRYLGGDYE